MAKPRLDCVISHWDHLFEGWQHSSLEFYGQLEKAIAERALPDTRISRIELHEGGVLSPKRHYLRIWRRKLTFDVCAAPFGKGFFVSWWLSEAPSGCLGVLLFFFPVLAPLAWFWGRRVTYYKLDTALMFQESVHLAILEVLERFTSAQGLRGLSEGEQKPVMKSFFAG